jgi:hypothetical protein
MATFSLAVVMIWIALDLLGWVPRRVSAFSDRISASVFRVLGSKQSGLSLSLFGALTFFLPCAFTQTVQILALGAGGFWQGAGLRGHIFLFGGETVWLEGLKSGLCNAAFITIVMCDSVAMSPHKKGLVRRLPELLRDETFTGMVCERVPMTDMWGAAEVQLEFCNYTKPQQA